MQYLFDVDSHLGAAGSSLKQPTAALHIGDHVACNDACGVFRPCNYCGHPAFIIQPGTGPHAAYMRCEIAAVAADSCRGTSWTIRHDHATRARAAALSAARFRL
jgi:hypothetical protein